MRTKPLPGPYIPGGQIIAHFSFSPWSAAAAWMILSIGRCRLSSGREVIVSISSISDQIFGLSSPYGPSFQSAMIPVPARRMRNEGPERFRRPAMCALRLGMCFDLPPSVNLNEYRFWESEFGDSTHELRCHSGLLFQRLLSRHRSLP